ncbi:type VI secretion system baseplate subunit TssF [Caulobacter segnis]
MAGHWPSDSKLRRLRPRQRRRPGGAARPPGALRPHRLTRTCGGRSTALLAIRSEPVTRRVPGAGRSAFARGQRLRLKLDDALFENGRMFLFSAVLERFLGEFATVNAFTECVFNSPQEGTFAQWPPRMGERRNI